jgi:hypothetical protein
MCSSEQLMSVDDDRVAFLPVTRLKFDRFSGTDEFSVRRTIDLMS